MKTIAIILLLLAQHYFSLGETRLANQTLGEILTQFEMDELETKGIEVFPEYLKVYPNPADKYITVEYRIENESENIVLKVADTESRVVYARKLANKEDSQLIDIKDFTQGSYIVYLEVDGKVVDSKIVSVTK
ncbi:MAG TPA: T9SS type A sorting domain-containing protein [Bacteroidales bacterium]|nr:T9SS type A sorting domain-containing protein [Bacteroidales bacterium]